ncbi:MAG TPA: YfiR family protein [Ramlibacter sp.]|nr:YfiR family protein [Ramlibacter sp.]
MADVTLRRRTFLALLPAAWPAAAAAADDEAIAERRVKAAYLYRFASYVQWPEDTFTAPSTPLVIGVWGYDELAEDLTALVRGRTVDGRPVEARRLRDADALAGLHMLFIGRARSARLGDTVGNQPLRGTLVVTETPRALLQGSIINFLLSEGQVRFELSLEAAEKRGLKLSSRLVTISQNLSGKAR